MKKVIQVTGLIFLIIFSAITVLIGSFIYITKYRVLEVGREKSADRNYEVIFQMIGEPEWPFGSTTGRFVVNDLANDRQLQETDLTIFDDGATFRDSNWEVTWYPVGVEIIISGSEQENGTYVIYYDGSDRFKGYTKEQAVAWIQKKYGSEVRFVSEQNNTYTFDEGGFGFEVQKDFYLTDNYEKAYYEWYGEQFSAAHNRYIYFEEDNSEYIPVVGFNGRQAGEIESFCNAVCDLAESFEKVPFDKFIYYIEEQDFTFDMKGYLEPYSRNALYNAVYEQLEQISLRAIEEEETPDADYPEAANTDRSETFPVETESNVIPNGDSDGTNKSEAFSIEITEEILEYYKSLEPDASYKMKDGTAYNMLPVDRACGSSYYILTAAKGNSLQIINMDPYLGQGGEARWISFLENEQTGFSCLSYSGGSYGLLFRTADGGKTFREVTYPSANALLSDGTIYNPFVMPEKVWEEKGKMYLLVGQGPDGDYYGEKGYCNGLFESTDQGVTWSYLGEEAVKR